MRRIALLAVVSLALASCTTSSAFRAGQAAERRQDYDVAVVEYSKASQQDPEDRNARQSLARVRLRAAQEHVKQARRFVARGLLKEAIESYQLAADLNPGAETIKTEQREVEQ